MVIVCNVAMNMSRVYSTIIQGSDNQKNSIFVSRLEDILKRFEGYITKINDSNLNAQLYRELASVCIHRNDR